jgi:hypothetical protein
MGLKDWRIAHVVHAGSSEFWGMELSSRVVAAAALHQLQDHLRKRGFTSVNETWTSQASKMSKATQRA